MEKKKGTYMDGWLVGWLVGCDATRCIDGVASSPSAMVIVPRQCDQVILKIIRIMWDEPDGQVPCTASECHWQHWARENLRVDQTRELPWSWGLLVRSSIIAVVRPRVGSNR